MSDWGVGSEEEERRRRGKEREIIVRPGVGERERGAVCPARCKTRGIRRAARLINRVLSSSNWQSSNNHLEAPPVNPELILGVTVRRHSYQLGAYTKFRAVSPLLFSSRREGEFRILWPRFRFSSSQYFPPPHPHLPIYTYPPFPSRLRYLIPCPRLHLI